MSDLPNVEQQVHVVRCPLPILLQALERLKVLQRFLIALVQFSARNVKDEQAENKTPKFSKTGTDLNKLVVVVGYIYNWIVDQGKVKLLEAHLHKTLYCRHAC